MGLGKTTGKQHRPGGRGMAGGKRGGESKGDGPGWSSGVRRGTWGRKYRNQRLGIRTDLDQTEFSRQDMTGRGPVPD